MLLPALLSIALVFSLMIPASVARASATVYQPDDHFISQSVVDRSSAISTMALDTPEGNVTPIEFGETLSGSIDDVGEEDTYTFSAEVNDTVISRLDTTSSGSNPQISYIEVTPSLINIQIGEPVQFTARAYDNTGNEIADLSFNWSTDVGFIDSSGYFHTTIGSGTTGSSITGYVRAFYGSVYGEARINIVSIQDPRRIYEQPYPEHEMSQTSVFASDVSGSISGHVYQDDGVTPIADIQVWAESYCSNTYIHTHTAEDGSYSITVPSGWYYVKARPTPPYIGEYYNNAYNRDAATPVFVTAPYDTSDIDFILDVGGTISGHVYKEDGLTPIPNMLVIIDGINNSFGDSAATEVDGSYSLALPMGTYNVWAFGNSEYAAEFYDNAYYEYEATPVSVTVPDDTPGIDFILERGGTISGFVYDEAGMPLPGVIVSTDYPISGHISNFRGFRTADDGSYTITGLQPGNYKVQAYTTGYIDEYYDNVYESSEATPVQVTAHSDTPGINFYLDFGGSISGVVKDDSGSPMVGARIDASGIDTDCYAYGCTADDGSYIIAGLQPDSYKVSAEAPGYVPEYYDNVYEHSEATPVPVTVPNNTPNIDFSLEIGGSISGVVADDSGNPIVGAWVAARGYDVGGYSYSETRTDGSYTITGLRSGNYSVCASASVYIDEYYDNVYDYSEATPVSVVKPNNTPNINFSLELGGSISGVVKDDSGNPIVGAWVDASGYDVSGYSYSETRTDGSYTITGLRSGNYSVYASASVYIDEYYDNVYDYYEATPVSVTAPDETTGINFALGGAGTISGVVEDDSGNPIAGATVCADGYDVSDYAYTETSGDGNYTIGGLHSGSYIVSVEASGYLTEYYDNVYDYYEATPVSVTAPDETTGINFALGGGTISGVVEDDSGNPIAGATVCADGYDVSDYACSQTAGDGNYTIGGLHSGSYIVSAEASGYLTTYYDNVYDWNDATPVIVTAQNDTPNVNFSLIDRYIFDIYPSIVTNSTAAIVHILGLGFTTGMQVELRGAEASNIQAHTVVYSSPTMIVAHFDLSDALLGTYDMAITWPGSYEELIGSAVEVAELQEGALYSFPDIDMNKGDILTYHIEVPETHNLFITLQKTTLVGYGYSWGSELLLLRGEEEIATASGSDDLILHIIDPEPGSYTINITAFQAGSGILGVWASLPNLPLGEWMVGTIYTSYGSIWYQVEVPPAQDALCFEAEAMGLWSHFDIYYEEYGGADQWVSPEGTQTSIEIPNPEPGTYIVEFLDSAMLYNDSQYSEDQTRDVLIKADTTFTVEPPPGYLPTITSVSTDRGGNTGFVTVEIKGGWLDANATVSLVRSGYEDIVAQNVYGSSDGIALTATFDLTDKEPGEWNLVVTNPNGQSATAPSPFTIEQGGTSELWVETIGREQIRIEREQTFVIRYGNRGTVDSGNVILQIMAPSGMLIKSVNGVALIEPRDGRASDFPILVWIDNIPGQAVVSIPVMLYAPQVQGYAQGILAVDVFEDSSFGDLSVGIAEVPGQLLNDLVEYLHDRVIEQGQQVTTEQIVGYLTAKLKEHIGVALVEWLVWGALTLYIPGIEWVQLGYGIVKGAVALVKLGIQLFDMMIYMKLYTVSSATPEDKYGPIGFDLSSTPPEELKRFVPPDQNFYYKVDFWNAENATAPAYDVFVEDQLDENLDWSTFRLEEIGFLDWTVKLEPCQYFNVNVDTRPEMDLIVNVEGTFDAETGAINWTFRSLDPDTMETPEDPMAGFLPPITESGREVGWVCFSVYPEASLPSGTQIGNQAFVNFDGIGPYNPAPKEGPWINTIDSLPYVPGNLSPEDGASGVPTNATLSWTGGDPDAGDTVTYDVYFGTNSTPPLVSNHQSGTVYDPGALAYNTKYYWQIIATDNRGASTTGPLWDFTTQSPTLGEAVDNTGLTWTTGGDANWFGQAGTYYYGGAAAQSGAISDSQSTWLKTTVTGPGTVGFYWKVSSESNHDFLRFYIDGVEQTRISGSVDWQQKSYTIRSGTHTVEWRYTKDGSVSIGSDCGWVDKVELPTITVTSPNGGEAWAAGSSQIIRWTYTRNPGAYVKIELFKGGVLSRTISLSRPIGTGGSGSYSWAIPSTQVSGTDYRVKITSTTNAAYTDTSNAAFTIIGPPPPAPTLKSPASASTVPSLTPRLEWNASSGAVSYGVQVSTSSSFANLLVNETGITNLYYDIAPGILKWNTTYYWRVNARNSFGSTSSWSTSRYFKTAVGPPPNAPSDLIATPISSSQINLTWQDNSGDETGFKIERKAGSGSYSQIATVGANVTSYSNTLLSASTTYYYRVRAYNAAGNSNYSNEASATTLPPPPPAPTLKSPAGASTVPSLTPRLEWNASSGAVSYGVQVSTSSSFTNLLVNETGITNLYYDIAPGILKWNTTYYWRVNARNSYGSTSSWSTSRYFKTAVGPPPNAPSDLTATPISSSQINLTWQDNSDNESGFKIERKTSTGSYSQIATVGAGVTSYSNTLLSASTTYYYRVRAYSAAGNSNYSNEASATTLPPPPSAPTLKSPASGSTVATLTPRLEWNASSGAVSYGIQISTSSSFANLIVNETGITDLYYDIAPGILKWNTTYYWRVNAQNSYGSTSSWSSYRYFKTAVGP
jgi:transcriptional regulator CtsR